MHKHNEKLILGLLLSFFSLCLPVMVVAEFDVKKDAKTGQWLISEDGQAVLQYNYATVPLPDGYLDSLQHGREYAVPRSDYIQPLFGLDGKPITKDWADDHAHHRGIYWAWPEVGYKGQFGDLHALQQVFARPTGEIQVAEKDGKLTLRADNLWKWEDEEPIVRETTLITIHPREQDGRMIDLGFRFKGLVDEVTLARRDTEHYGGLNIRMQPLPEFHSGFFPEKGKEAPNKPAWVYCTWKDKTSNKDMELVIFEKMSNPDYPGEYIEYPDIHWFQPTFPKNGERYVLKKDDALILHYRLWLHEVSGSDSAKLKRWQEFQNKP